MLPALRALVREEVTRASRDPEALASVDEAAAMLGMSAGAMRKAIDRGTIPARRIGRRVRVRVGDLLAIAEERR
jgi:excisionase family DNA binding protein